MECFANAPFANLNGQQGKESISTPEQCRVLQIDEEEISKETSSLMEMANVPVANLNGQQGKESISTPEQCRVLQIDEEEISKETSSLMDLETDSLEPGQTVPVDSLNSQQRQGGISCPEPFHVLQIETEEKQNDHSSLYETMTLGTPKNMKIPR
ncbi:hypothetical protein HNY73_022692 [Argiope bruennichi]|uniref:Uncharacterized protein n=1 Tax=Argiope bruennichi TaxID=94029 RepID=A0A8T0E372_ARGBR|nr:hypothetical protein HNY73_022692 [Argiope bruennichi]